MKLYLGSYFAFFTPSRDHWVEVEISRPTPLKQVLADLGIPTGEVHLVVSKNRVLETTDTLVSNDDVIRLYPAVGGG